MFDTDEEAAALGVYVAQNDFAIINALTLHAERMAEAAESARASYEQGQADKAVRAAQDASMIANNGYRQFAEMYGGEAAKMRRIIAEIRRMLDGPDDDIDDEQASDEEVSDGELVTRVSASVGDPGKWQAQYHDAETKLWHDIGDAQTGKADAERREADYRRAVLHGQPGPRTGFVEPGALGGDWRPNTHLGERT